MSSKQDKTLLKLFDLSVELSVKTHDGYKGKPDIPKIKALAIEIHRVIASLP